MGTNHTNASDAGAASRAGTTASPGIAADEWSRGESNPRPEPEQTFTAAQVLSLLRAKEAETVARLSRGYTRLAAAVIGAGERLGCTADDPMEVAAWLEKAAAAKAVADADATRCDRMVNADYDAAWRILREAGVKGESLPEAVRAVVAQRDRYQQAQRERVVAFVKRTPEVEACIDACLDLAYSDHLFCLDMRIAAATAAGKRAALKGHMHTRVRDAEPATAAQQTEVKS